MTEHDERDRERRPEPPREPPPPPPPPPPGREPEEEKGIREGDLPLSDDDLPGDTGEEY